MQPDLSLVVACYNEEPILEHSVGETFRVLDALRAESEIIFVDDASQDGTRDALARIVAAHPGREIKTIFHDRNEGRGGTVSDGILVARGRIVGFVDIDLEVHARHIPACVLAVDSGYDVATALRVYEFHWRAIDRYAMSRGYRWLMRTLLRVPLEDTETGFKFFRRDSILPVLQQTKDRGWFWDTEIMVRAYFAGRRIIEIPAPFVRRFDKKSTLRPVRDSVDYLVKLLRFRRIAAELRRGSR